MAKRVAIRLDDAIGQFSQRRTMAKLSVATVRGQQVILERFQRFAGNKMVHLIDPPLMNKYLFGPNGISVKADGEPLGSNSFNAYREAFMAFFRYAMLMNWADSNPMQHIELMRKDQPKPKLYLGAGELLALLEACESPVERIACALGMNTAMRANDIRNLTVFDVSLATGTIGTEIRKSRKLDVKPITSDLHNELVGWLDTYAEMTDLPSRADLPNDWYLVPVQYRTPRDHQLRLKPTQMHTHPWRLVKRPLARLGYPTKGQGFHTLRRSSARALFEMLRSTGEGRDHALMVVKDFLNHASVTQTETYLGLQAERDIRDSLLKDQPFLSQLAQAEQQRVSAGGTTGNGELIVVGA